MSQIENLSRRRFLGSAAALTGGLVLGVKLPLVYRPAQAAVGHDSLNAFLSITPDNVVHFLSPFVEMGQGVYTALPTIVAEELDAPLENFEIMQAPPGPEYRVMFGGTQRFTGGSYSVRSAFDALRRAGASARQMLVEAAAQRWNVDAASLETADGRVRNPMSGDTLSYGELAMEATALTPPAEPTLKDRADFQLIGKPLPRTDRFIKANGQAEFGIDVQVPGMVHAAIRQSPVYGGKPASVAKDAVLERPGVIAVELLDNAVAVVAEHFWQAKTALDALDIQWDEGDNAGNSTEAMREALLARVDEAGAVAEERGDAAGALAGAERVVEAVYHAPFLAHVTMEPMNCTASVTDESCEVWAPNQGVDTVVEVASAVTGLPAGKITVYTPFLGGGFGRRFMVDYAAQAMALSKAVQRPVKLIWTREEDTRHDHYRPLTVAKLRAGLDAAGKPVAFHGTLVGEGPLGRHMPQFLQNPAVDSSVVEGMIHQPYGFADLRVDVVDHKLPMPIGFWRSVGHSMNAFFKEAFMDEVAAASGQDPVAFRRALLSDQPRYRKVLDTVVEMAGWRSGVYRNDDGEVRAMGVALHESFGSICAQIAEVSVADGEARVHRVWCAIDPGTIVNPAIIEAQMQGGIVYGLSQTLLEEITVENGRVQQSNFPDYPVLPPSRMPEVSVRIIESGEAMGGIGEPGTPPIAAAVVNAVAALTGERIRDLPLRKHSLTLS